MSRIAAAFILVAIAAPASAERWQDFGKTKVMTSRLDLDALKREGDLVTYRVEITWPNNPRRAGWRAISTSVIDCSTGMRKNLSGETYLPDGTLRKNAGANRWQKIMEFELAAGVRDLYCRPADGSVST